MPTLKNKWDCTMEIFQKEGKEQKIKSTREIVCPRKKMEDYAITPEYDIDKFKCIKCYLCLAFSQCINLDKDRFPCIIENERENIEMQLNEEDFEKMDNGLSDDELTCLSKWIYGVFKSMGFEVYKEVGIRNISLPKNVLSLYSISDRKNKRADIELKSDAKILLFENKIYSSDKKWLLDALDQLNLYNQSTDYKNENTKLVFCFNTKIKKDIVSDIKKILSQKNKLKLPNTIEELIVVNTYDIYKCFIKNIDKKNKKDFIDMLFSNMVKI